MLLRKEMYVGGRMNTLILLLLLCEKQGFSILKCETQDLDEV